MSTTLRAFPLAATAGAVAALLGVVGQGTALAQGVPAPAVAYAPPTSRPAVGEVTFAVGPTVRVSADGVPENARRGTKVHAGDRLDTAEGGLLHVRFVDGALVSLRPGSRLWIEDYRYNPAQVTQSLVRFRLDHGVARAISGAAAEGAKERFRLNTPLVAIGVRGTDFVVRSDSDGTTASVNQGAIVMAPFSSGCLAQALGPCNSPTAKVLSAEMGQMLVEFRPQFQQPEIRPQQALAAAKPDSSQPSRPEPVVVASAAPRAAQPVEEASVSATLVRGIVNTPAPVPPAPPPVTAVAEPAAPQVDPPAPPAVVVAPVPEAPAPVQPPPPPPPPAPVVTAPPAPVIPPPPPPPPQLMWGRWSDSALPGDISVPREQAREGRGVTVGNDSYILYRQESSGSGMAAGLTSYQFTLQQSHAQFAGPAGVQAATVQGGLLGIDFANRSFSTSLNVTSAATGQVGISSRGFFRSDGMFSDRSVPGQVIAGAAALDGKTAGYLFEKAAAGGLLSGITLWSRP